jgi:hypothetical protein
VSHIIQEKGKVVQSKVGTRGSILTANILEAIPEPTKSDAQTIAQRFVQVFQSPVEHIDYLQSKQFGTDLIAVCESIEAMLEDEPRCIFMQSPVSFAS